ncbi:DUF1702 family protein [Chengkuizengella marina]|uniref:DUF1702 family protein n=1 Tax=Chengkuizengella marina TaxID=2507566 RepID=A0A6N9Q4X1_9BACL|nr:DUF1702 family protein [Chengkuizengella marina]NBI29813.1 DUF1702 family protein [Chengkuizengella marina]
MVALYIVLLILGLVFIKFLILKIINFRTFHRYIDRNKKDFYNIFFQKILSSFLYGLKLGLQWITIPNYVKQKMMKKVKPYYHGFAYEGYSMGIAAKLTITGQKKYFERHVKKVDPTNIYQYYVGLGWWLYKLHIFNRARYQKWIIHLDPRLAPVIYDGIGFSAALERFDHDKHFIASFQVLKEKEQRVLYQGIGRCLWFLKQFDIVLALDSLAALPNKYHKDCASGLGLAAAYSFFDQMDQVFMATNKIPTLLKAAFLQGMGFGFEARRLQNPLLFKNMLLALNVNQRKEVTALLDIVDAVKQELYENDEINQGEFYYLWIDLVRECVEKRGGKFYEGS